MPGESHQSSRAPGSGEAVSIVERVTEASNATFRALVGDLAVAYKPVRGERPLWDFPDGTLAGREVAAYAVSEALGWGIVPQTWLGAGPYGPGTLQRWCEPDPESAAVDLVPASAPREGFLVVLEGLDAQGRAVCLVHEDSAALRRIALFDVVVNNADRKGGHVLTMAGGHRYGIDHGLTFHHEPKMRTVLWGWAGAPLSREEVQDLRSLHEALDGTLAHDLREWLSLVEVDATLARLDQLLTSGSFPTPDGQRSPIPWPPF